MNNNDDNVNDNDDSYKRKLLLTFKNFPEPFGAF